mmetsp:Transcript_51173/g.144147  ORF Transcript_51173/g.144147 Transcript_51173/m.144147 type:complete len:218 (-) Transcript_51173:421-1074(-)
MACVRCHRQVLWWRVSLTGGSWAKSAASPLARPLAASSSAARPGESVGGRSACTARKPWASASATRSRSACVSVPAAAHTRSRSGGARGARSGTPPPPAQAAPRCRRSTGARSPAAVTWCRRGAARAAGRGRARSAETACASPTRGGSWLTAASSTPPRTSSSSSAPASSWAAGTGASPGSAWGRGRASSCTTRMPTVSSARQRPGPSRPSPTWTST